MGWSWRDRAELAGVYGLAAIAGWLFSRAGVPLPWMIGPLAATACLYVSGLAKVTVPVRTRPAGQLVVAAQVGLSFSPAALALVADLAPVLVGMAFATALCALSVALILRRTAGIGLAPALLGVMPTSPVEAAVMAKQFDIDPAPIVLSQTLRIAAVVVLVPIAIYIVDGWPDRNGFAQTRPPFDPLGLGLLVLCGVAGAASLKFLRISNPYFLGPLAASAAVTAAGVEPAPFPYAVLACAQLILGSWLGSTFRRRLFATAGRLVSASIASTLLLLSMTTTIALGLAWATGLDWEVLALGAAPGGVTEMALTAAFLHQNVPLVTAFHLTRIFLIVPNIPWVVRRLHRLERSWE